MAQPDFTAMTPDEFAAWQQQQNNPQGGNVEMATKPDVPTPPAPPQARPATEVWGQVTEYDFTCPSGATCRLRKLSPERLVETGLLDKLTRLPGFAQELIEKSEGQPPAKPQDEMTVIKDVLVLMQDLLPMIVAQPTIHKDPESDADREVGEIYVSSIDLADRMAILNQATGGVTKLDAFREES